MKPRIFYQRISRISAMTARRRHAALGKLSASVLEDYLGSLRAISPERAAAPVSDGRTLTQLVGHIVEWDRWTILAGGEIAAGVRFPQIMSLQGYYESNGTALEFSDLDDFNGYQAAKYSTRSWSRVLDLAIHTSTAVHRLYSDGEIVPAEYLDETDPYEWLLPDGERINLPCGWYLWIAALEHKAVAHVQDLDSFPKEANQRTHRAGKSSRTK